MVRPVQLGGVVAFVMLSAGQVHAGGRPYAFAAGVDSLPPLELEIENWFTADNPRGAEKASWDWWVGPVAGITDSIEVGLFPIFVQHASVGGAPTPGLQFSEVRAQLSWLLAPKQAWPLDVRLRLEYGQPILDGAPYTIWLGTIVSHDFGRLNLTLNPEAWLSISKAAGATETEVEEYFEYAGGLSYDVSHGARLGAEAFGVGEFKELDGSQHFAGPALSYATGRIWTSVSVGIGISHPSSTARGRLVIGFVL